MIRRAAEMRQEVREAMRGGPGAVTIRHYFGKEEFTAKARLCAKLILPPGAGIGLHEHAAEDEVYIVVRGRGMLDEGDGEVAVEAGDAILTGNGASHAIRNDGTEPLEIIAVIQCYAG
jgi:mannose-6-phosphate isomerase-like protein (cupin superfamily)